MEIPARRVILGVSMSVVISMLRGVNVGGHHLIRMDVLKALCESLGLRNVQTYLQSGNVIFAMAFDPRKSTVGAEGLFLRIARGLKALSGATHVRVTLEAADVYTIETVKITRAFEVVPLRRISSKPA